MREIPFWGWVLGLLPSAIIYHHACFLAFVKSPSVLPQGQMDANKFRESSKKTGILSAKAVEALLPPYQIAAAESQKYFSAPSLFFRYEVPVLLNAVIGVTVFYMLCQEVLCCGRDLSTIYTGILFGSIGAYVYVLLTLGQRNFQHDITSGAAVWCAVQVAIGPILGAVVVYLIGAPKSDGDGTFAAVGLSFLAGFAPRFVVNVLLERVGRAWFSPNTVQSPRVVPLTHIRGISSWIENRLNEEGVYDVYGLAGANPVRLLRSTSFDRHQVLGWIDEALLLAAAPQAWLLLENEGITGAVDLAWYAQANAEDDQERAASQKDLEDLAMRVKLDGASLRNLVERLFEDDQVRLVWALYSVDFEEVATVGASSPLGTA